MKKLLFFIIFISACQPKKTPIFTVAAAANIQFAMEEIVANFEKKQQTKVNLVIGSSGKLTAQIIQGAPYSIFLSADKKYPALLSEKGKAIGLPQIYALGNLNLWSAKDLIIKELSDLKNANFKKIAIANPQTAPYGKQAVNVLKYYNLWDSIQTKLVFAENIAQTNQYILSGACDVGITAASTAFAKNIEHKGTWLAIDSQSYNPIEQGAVITTYGQQNHTDISKQFYDFLFSKSAKMVFSKYNYGSIDRK
jgi:molybdate transport system substrate-binding protein